MKRLGEFLDGSELLLKKVLSKDTELFSKEKFEFQTEESCILRARGGERRDRGKGAKSNSDNPEPQCGHKGGCPAMGAVALCHIPLGHTRQLKSLKLFIMNVIDLHC